MKFDIFSKKQLIVLTWWTSKSKFKNQKGIICDGSVRSGKSLSMSASYIFWAMKNFDGQQFGMSGRTVASFKRNVIFWLIPLLKSRGYKVEYKDDTLIVRIKDKETGKVKINHFYVFGGRDESSYATIQGMTAAGWYFDEAALQPQSFVNQAISRCSVKGSKLWFNCNPDMPNHWFKLEFIDKVEELNMLHIHFTMDDNPSLDEEVKQDYKKRFTGVFYLRYILGLWALSEGIIYDMFTEENNVYLNLDESIKLNSTRYFAIDYGTTNPFVVLDIYDNWDVSYQENEIYYDSKKAQKRLPDIEYLRMIKELEKKEEIPVTKIVVDPSAESLIVLLRNEGYVVKLADNSVREGIVCTSSALWQKKYKINKNNCKMTISELGGYVWDDKAKQRGEEKPVKLNDHAMDAMRYFINTIMRKRILGRA